MSVSLPIVLYRVTRSSSDSHVATPIVLPVRADPDMVVKESPGHAAAEHSDADDSNK